MGFLTTVLAIWLWVRETRGKQRWTGVGLIGLAIVLMGVRVLPVYLVLAGAAPGIVAISLYQIRRRPSELRWWGIIAFAVVILQGVLGGLRVVWLKDQIGIFHATLAQLFFALMCFMAVLTRPRLAGGALRTDAPYRAFLNLAPKRLFLFRRLLLLATFLILAQLILGATMRHQHAGLAIPDFPLAYGKAWPAMDADSVARYNRHRLETVALNPITPFQIGLQMTHRITAILILASVALCWVAARRDLGRSRSLSRYTALWLGMVVVQAFLGAATIWLNKPADIATTHVVLGALTLALGIVLSMICCWDKAVAWNFETADGLQPASLKASASSPTPQMI